MQSPPSPPPSLAPGSTRAQASPSGSVRLGLGALLVLLTWVVYSRALSGELVYDDLLLVGSHPQIRSLDGLLEAVARPYWAFDAPTEGPLVGFWRPLTTCTLALGHHLGGGEPFAFHALSLTLHSLASLLCWRFLTRVSGRPQLAYVGALLFALHPVHVESVAWISAVNDPLYALFGLLALDRFARWRIDRATSGTTANGTSQRPPWSAGAWLFLALLAKEQALAVLTVAWTVSLVLPVRPRASAPAEGTRSRVPGGYLPLLVAAFAYVLCRMLVFQSALAGFDRQAAHFALAGGRLASYWVELFGGFLGLLAWPVELSVFRQVRPEVPPLDPTLVRAGVLLAVWAVATLLAWRQRRRVLLGALLFVPASLAPVLLSFQSAGAFPLSDRYLYLGVAGWCLLLVAGSAQLARPRGAIVAGLVLAAVYGWQSHSRSAIYQTDERFFEAAVEASPRSPYVHWGMGRVLLERYQVERDKPLLDGAMLHFLTSLYLGEDYGEHAPKLPADAPLEERVSELNAIVNDTPADQRKPDPTVSVSRSDREQANIGLGWCYLFLAELPPDYDLGTPQYVFEQTVKLFPESYRALSGLGAVYLKSGELDRAIETFQAALNLYPEHAESWHNLGQAHIKRQDWDAARDAFEQALKVRPGHQPDLVGIATTAIEAGRFEIAEATLADLRERYPDSLEPLFWSGMLAARQRDFTRALQWFDDVLRKERGHGYAHLERGKLLLQMNETQEAIKALGRACELISDSFEAHYNLGSLLLSRVGPAESEPYLVRAFELSTKGKLRDALHYELRKVLAGKGREALQLAQLSQNRGEFGHAFEWVTDAIGAGEPWSSSASAHHLRGEVLDRLQQPEEAAAAYKRALELRDDRFWTHHNLGMVLAKLGRQAEARPHLERAKALIGQIDSLDPTLRRAIGRALDLGIDGNLDFSGPAPAPIRPSGPDERYR